MIKQLKELPIKINSQRRELLDLSNSLEDVTLKIKNWELNEMQDIASMTDGNGKPAFSNAEKRQVELEQRKGNDESMFNLKGDYGHLKNKIDLLRIELQFNLDVQENLRAIAWLGGDTE